MVNKVSIIGGDLRIIKLAQMLAKDNFEVSVFGLEKEKSLLELDNIKKCDSLDEATKNSDFIIGPIPLSSNGVYINTPFSDCEIELKSLADKLKGKTFVAGSIKKEFYDMVEECEVIDLIEREELAVLNAISTAEGAIQIAMEETPKTIHGTNILILGFGRIGKMLAKMLNGLGAHVSCEARKESDIAWIKAYGYKFVYLSDLKENLGDYEIIINTVPKIILDEENLRYVKKDSLLIDLASNPGGIDKQVVKKMGLKFVWALSLPGKVAPVTSAEYIKNTIYNILKEIK